MDPTEAILASNPPFFATRQRCFAGKPRSSSGRRPLWPLTGGNVLFPFMEITGGCRVTADDRKTQGLVASLQDGAGNGPVDHTGRSPLTRGIPDRVTGAGEPGTNERTGKIGRTTGQPANQSERTMEEFCMNENNLKTKDDAEIKIAEREEIMLGGVEIHATIADRTSKSGISLEFRPLAGSEHSPPSFRDLSAGLVLLCRTIVHVNDRAKNRLRRLVVRDSGNDRILYRLVISQRGAGTGSECLIRDGIDPEFARIDAGFRSQTRGVRDKITCILDGVPQ
jgi:hypothetical protein